MMFFYQGERSFSSHERFVNHFHLSGQKNLLHFLSNFLFSSVTFVYAGHGKRNGGGGAIGQEFSSLSGDGISNVDVTGGPSSPPAWLMGLLDRNSGRILPLRMVTQLLRGRNSNYVNGNKVLMRSSAMHKVKREQDDEGVEGLGGLENSGVAINFIVVNSLTLLLN